MIWIVNNSSHGSLSYCKRNSYASIYQYFFLSKWNTFLCQSDSPKSLLHKSFLVQTPEDKQIWVRHSRILPLNILTPELFCFLSVLYFHTVWGYLTLERRHTRPSCSQCVWVCLCKKSSKANMLFVRCFNPFVKLCLYHNALFSVFRNICSSTVPQTLWCAVGDCLCGLSVIPSP